MKRSGLWLTASVAIGLCLLVAGYLQNVRRLRAESEMNALLSHTASARAAVQRVSKPRTTSPQARVTQSAFPSPFPAHETPEEKAARIKAYVRACAVARYSAFLRKIGTTSGQREQFLSLVVEASYQNHDLAEAAKEQNLDGAADAVGAMSHQQWLAAENAEAAVLTPDQASALRQYDRTDYTRSLESAVGGQLFGVDSLTAPQAQAITDALCALSPSYQAGNAVYAGELNPAQIESKLATILSPNQLKIVSDQLEGDAALAYIGEKVQKASNSSAFNLSRTTQAAAP